MGISTFSSMAAEHQQRAVLRCLASQKLFDLVTAPMNALLHEGFGITYGERICKVLGP